MNILYINGHPDLHSFQAVIRDRYVAGLKGSKHKVRVLNLGEQRFDPVLRFGYHKHMKKDAEIEKDQQLVLWADHIVLAFPIWWGDAPALLKGWIERVFAPGLTYRFEAGHIDQLLKGKTADIIFTQRGVRPLAWLFGNHAVSILKRNLFSLTGIKTRKVLSLGAIGLGGSLDSATRRQRFLATVERTARNLVS